VNWTIGLTIYDETYFKMNKNITSSKRKAVLIGAGSIGKKHLKILLEKFESIIIVDPNNEVSKYILNFSNANAMTYLSGLAQLENRAKIDLAVISNWGPDHFSTFIELVAMGVKNFIIEKPLTDSFYELEEMQKLIDLKNLNVKTCLPMMYSEIPNMLVKFEEFYSVGAPQAIIVYGGAKCVATIGIHYIALANYLFKSRPVLANAYLQSDNINPRNSKLVYLEGNAHLVYPGKRYLNLNFSNLSQIDHKCVLLYKHAEIIINGQTLTLNRIPSQSLTTLDKPTKTLKATELLFTTEVNSPENFMISLDSLYESFSEATKFSKNDMGFAATYDLLSVLVASRLKKTINLPIGKNIMNLNYQRKWGIS